MIGDFVLERKTRETNISLRVCFNKNINFIEINSGIPFFDHLLMQTSFHGCFSTYLKCAGDLDVDTHHTVEDIGIVYGKLFGDIFKLKQAERYVFSFVPFDDALTRIVLDISGRPYLVFNVQNKNHEIKGISMYTIMEFFKSFTSHSKTTIHIENYGFNNHHKMESIFKCFGILLKRVFDLKKSKHNYSTKDLW
ncbi:imidazoleglycerol-phosphate dehydratase [Candidatus Vidania fulgoroideae]|uniref:Imidazoleglycerol-phosphate dehydratase n=1 Tax=Candidatus Vidania fulgoroideorum TaxID=881286 RepID=A0A974X7R2_9PROT|nr:imidazoleglycerol-phosphate dehydratase [Candidatus Vidania fulgoroideae]